jgi:ABC-type Fe3+ transport system permease subunit
MLRLFAIVLLALISSLVATACYLVIVANLARQEGWRQGLLGLVCPPYVFAWGWRQTSRAPHLWMGAWTCATTLAVLIVAFLELEMG